MPRSDVFLLLLVAVVILLLLARPVSAQPAGPVTVRTGPYGTSIDYSAETNAGGRCCG